MSYLKKAICVNACMKEYKLKRKPGPPKTYDVYLSALGSSARKEILPSWNGEPKCRRECSLRIYSPFNYE